MNTHFTVNSYFTEILRDVYCGTKGQAFQDLILVIIAFFFARFISNKTDSVILACFCLSLIPGWNYAVRRVLSGGGCLFFYVRIALIPILGLVYYPFMLLFSIMRLRGWRLILNTSYGKAETVSFEK